MFVEAKFFHKAGEGSGGGSDPHNLGYYADLTALQTAYPTGTDGDFAILGSTDTIWVWDSGTSAWKDTDTKGQVTSVNNQTGAVTLGINDVAPTQTGKSGYILGTDGFVAGWVRPEIVQRSALPQASEEEVGKIYQFIGTTDANYTNGYFYKCVSDGGNPATYSWARVNVQPGSSLPSQTGNSGKFLTTDGTDASWGDSAEIQASIYSTRFGPNSSFIKNNVSQRSATAIGSGATSYSYSVAVGAGAKAQAEDAIAIGCSAKANVSGAIVIHSDSYGVYQTALGSVNIGIGSVTGQYCVAVGPSTSASANYGVCVGNSAQTTALRAIQIGAGTNSEAGTFCVSTYTNNAVQNNKVLNADGTIPTDRFTTTPSADGTYVPTLTISSGVATRTWGAAASAPVVPATMPTLAVADWSSNTQTVNVTGVTASNIVFVSPAPASAADYAAAGIVCTAQGSGTLTFTCATVPSNAITVNVVILG